MNFFKYKGSYVKYSALILFSLLIFLVIIKPDIGKNAAIIGILLCGRVIIPSLFTFTVCILFIMKALSGGKKEKILIFLFSCLGGYPIGAKLLNNAVQGNKISPKKAGRMLNYCVNAGPAFVIGATGGIIGSQKLGYILFASHILSSLILAVLLKDKREKNQSPLAQKEKSFKPTESFVESVADASATTLSICSFVILFSVISAYLEYLSAFSKFFKYSALILEITTAVTKTGNIYLISFLLGFSGICVWCQIISSARLIKINLLIFALFRMIHGILSGILTAVFIKSFGITLPCITNSVIFSGSMFYSTPALALSLICLGIIFLIATFTKKYTGNIIEDMV